MDYKLDYMTRLFAKISNKKTEAYIINRIWHQLDDDSVQFIVQQYIKRAQGTYALTDLYLPQIQLFIEIDEPFHKNNIERDKIRNDEIATTTHSEVKIIDCDNSMENIHKQISDVVELIRQKIKEKGANFREWGGENTLSVAYHQKKGYLSVNDNEYIRTIDDAFAIFEANAKHRGFLRVAGADIPNKEEEIVWCPNGVHHSWNNTLSEDGLTICEYNKTNEQRRKAHVEKWTTNNQRRVTFFRDEDELGFRLYRFVGVFVINKEKSIKENMCIWERVSDFYQL